jgi:predicted O-methyltransferase YrrM
MFYEGSKIELGTNLGISTAHIALAEPKSTVYTFEGAPEIAAQAKAFFKETALNNVELIVGNIDDTLPELLSKVVDKKFSLAFLDANHRYEPTLRYYHLLKPYMADNSVIIFDDIYHNPEMIKAWQELCKTETDSLRLDFYFWGVMVKGSSKGYYSVHLKP